MKNPFKNRYKIEVPKSNGNDAKISEKVSKMDPKGLPKVEKIEVEIEA